MLGSVEMASTLVNTPPTTYGARVSDDYDHKRFQEGLKSGRIYSRKDHEGNDVMGIQGTGPRMIMERTRRCQNCQFWDRGERMGRRVKDCMDRDREVLLKGTEERKPMTPQQVERQLHRLASTLATGEFGLCVHRDPPPVRTSDGDLVPQGDFVHFKLRCDGWDGRVVVRPGEDDLDVSEAGALSHLGEVDGG